MANIVPVKKDKHQKLKLAEKRTLSHINNHHIVPISIGEYVQASASFPIVFVKDPGTEQYRSVVMLGLEASENLFYRDEKWQGLYMPQSLTVSPFTLGIDPEVETIEPTLTTCIDLDSPLVGEDKELPLYDDEGNESELYNAVKQSLARIYENEKMTDRFIKELKANDLILELELRIQTSQGQTKKLVGIYTINDKKLATLDDETVLDYHKRGLFMPIHAMLSSLAQVNRLFQIRNEFTEQKLTSVQIAPAQQEALEAANA
jgi:hypothetical protein